MSITVEHAAPNVYLHATVPGNTGARVYYYNCAYLNRAVLSGPRGASLNIYIRGQRCCISISRIRMTHTFFNKRHTGTARHVGMINTAETGRNGNEFVLARQIFDSSRAGSAPSPFHDGFRRFFFHRRLFYTRFFGFPKPPRFPPSRPVRTPRTVTSFPNITTRV